MRPAPPAAPCRSLLPPACCRRSLPTSRDAVCAAQALGAPAAAHCAPPSFPLASPKQPTDSQVQDVLRESGKQLGAALSLSGFVRVQVGEGLEAEQKDFAAEVAETLKAAA